MIYKPAMKSSMPLQNFNIQFLYSSEFFLYTCLVILLFPTSLTGMYPFLWSTVIAAKFVIAGIVFISYLLRGKISKLIICFCVLNAFLIISGLMSDAEIDIQESFKLFVNVITCMFFELALFSSAKKALKTYVYFSCTVIIINLLFLLIFPDGFAQEVLLLQGGVWDGYNGRMNFLAIDNGLPPILLSFNVSVVMYDLFNRGKISVNGWIMILISSVTILITWSATGVVGWFIFIIYLLLRRTRLSRKIFNFPTIFFTNIIMWLAIIIVRVQELFSWLIVDLLQKDITFTGRVAIWDMYIELIKNRPISGWGQNGVAKYIPVSPGTGMPYGAHNTFLQLTANGGIFALISWIALLLIVGKSVHKVRNHPMAILACAGLFSMLTSHLTESYYDFKDQFIMFVFLANIPYIIKQQSIERLLFDKSFTITPASEVVTKP